MPHSRPEVPGAMPRLQAEAVLLRIHFPEGLRNSLSPSPHFPIGNRALTKVEHLLISSSPGQFAREVSIVERTKAILSFVCAPAARMQAVMLDTKHGQIMCSVDNAHLSPAYHMQLIDHCSILSGHPDVLQG